MLHTSQHLSQLTPASRATRHNLGNFPGLQELLDQAVDLLHTRSAAAVTAASIATIAHSLAV
jgi:hypothetical protein